MAKFRADGVLKKFGCIFKAASCKRCSRIWVTRRLKCSCRKILIGILFCSLVCYGLTEGNIVRMLINWNKTTFIIHFHIVFHTSFRKITCFILEWKIQKVQPNVKNAPVTPLDWSHNEKVRENNVRVNACVCVLNCTRLCTAWMLGFHIRPGRQGQTITLAITLSVQCGIQYSVLDTYTWERIHGRGSRFARCFFEHSSVSSRLSTSFVTVCAGVTRR